MCPKVMYKFQFQILYSPVEIIKQLETLKTSKLKHHYKLAAFSVLNKIPYCGILLKFHNITEYTTLKLICILHYNKTDTKGK